MRKSRALAGLVVAVFIAASSGVAPSLAGSQPSAGAISYSIDDQISNARDALRQARNLLVQATKKADSLRRQAAKESDLTRKLALLQETAAILKTSVRLKSQVEGLEKSLEALSIRREALQTAQRLAEEQARERAEAATRLAQEQLPPQATMKPLEKDVIEALLAKEAVLTPQEIVSNLRFYLAMSKYAYDQPGLSGSATSWIEFASEMGLSPDEAGHIAQAGFQAIVKETGSTVAVSFAGSNDINDWLQANAQDTTQILLSKVPTQLRGLFSEQEGTSGSVGQFLVANALVQAVSERYPDKEIVLTGHSLAGGLAAYVAALRGLKAVTFDPEGVVLNSKEAAIANTGGILNLVVEGGDVPLGSSIGTTVVFDNSRLPRESLYSMSLQVLAVINKPREAAHRAVDAAFYWHDLDRFYDIMDGAVTSADFHY